MRSKLWFSAALLQLVCLSSYGNIFGEDQREILSDSIYLPIGKLHTSPTAFCTATLISLDEVATAAHCLMKPDGEDYKDPLPHFEIKDRRGQIQSAQIIDINRPFDVNPVKYRGADFAIVKLDRPLGSEVGFIRAEHRELNGLNLGVRERISLVAFHHDKSPDELFVSSDCTVYQFDQSGIIHHDCDLTSGSSGGPLLYVQNGDLSSAILIGVQSAQYTFLGIEKFDRYKHGVRNVGAQVPEMGQFDVSSLVLDARHVED